jgi:hypothetical protein
MHTIEPYYSWRDIYIASDDALSPFYGEVNSEFEFTHAIYDHLIHPQWDFFGSHTLYLKILYADYLQGFVVIELFGEWNDCLYNDIMYLKRNVIEVLMENGIDKFILIGENVLNFHRSEDSYYEEWFDELEEGWIVAMNFRDYVLEEFRQAGIDSFFSYGGVLDMVSWRRMKPQDLCHYIDQLIIKRLNP